MTAIVNRTVEVGQKPVHVLIVVVGDYTNGGMDLHGASEFAQTIFDFWRSPDRMFPGDQVLSSIAVLASDPNVSAPHIVDGTIVREVDVPSYGSVNSNVRAWVERIKEVDGAVGILHWVGHGTESSRGGSVVTLACHGKVGQGDQDGLNWTTTLHWLNEQTAGHPVYCFIDACRNPPTSGREYMGIDSFDLYASNDNAYVYMSTERRMPAFWITDARPATVTAGCEGHAIGTRAFLASLEGFGARHVPGAQKMPITSAQLVEAARALVRRWAAHEDLQMGAPVGPGGPETHAILLTKAPKSAVDVVIRNRSTPASCDAQPGSSTQIFGSETKAAPFQFRLARKPHRFRLDGKHWGPELELLHPHVEFLDGDSYS